MGKICQCMLVVVLMLGAATAQAQLVAFTGKDANSPDEFAFVALQTLGIGTELYFTNQAWDNTAGTFVVADDEGTLRFTVTSEIAKGTVVQISETAVDTFTVTDSFSGSPGTATIVTTNGATALLGWSPTSADPHYAFAASNASAPLTSVTEVYAFLDTVVTQTASEDPTTGTNASPSAVVLFYGVQAVGVDFNADRSTATVASLTNPMNFLESSGATNLTLDLTQFTNPALPVTLMEFGID